MNDQPTIGLPPTDTGSLPAGDPTRDSAPTAPPMPDLSMASDSFSSTKYSAPEPPKLDGYRVIKPIGEGGMGTVWQALQLSTRRNVALKLISAAGFGSERARQRFDREVEITARLEHPNIARVYDSGINRGVYFYAMEMIDGVPLDQYVSNHHLSRAEILRLFAVVCHAVDHAHQRGVIHRDLKPGNILVSPDGQPHILDFGLAKALEQAGKEAGISIEGDIAGTPGFMSPEQAAGKLDLDPRCDVYSLGVILYRLLTGQTPHDLSGTYLDILQRVSHDEPKRPRAADRTMDRELEALLLHALERDASQRYTSAGAMAQDIENYANGDPITAKPPTLAYVVQKRARKHWLKITIIAILALLAGVGMLLTARLIFAHRAAIAIAKQWEREKQIAARVKLESDLAQANKLVFDGDEEIAAGKFAEAKSSYLSAESAYNTNGVQATRADLALWNLERIDPSPLITIPPPKTSSAIAPTAISVVILADNRRALAGYSDGNVRVFDMATGRLLQTIAAEKGAVRSVAASADGTWVLTGGDVGSVKLWDLATGVIKADFRNRAAPLMNRVTHVALSPDGRHALSVSGATPELLASPAHNDTITLWDISSGNAVLTTNRATKTFDVNQTVTSASFSADSSMVLTASAQTIVWSVRDGRQIAAIPASAMAANFSPEGLSSVDSVVIAGSSDGAVRRLDIKSGKVDVIQERGSPIEAIGFDSQQGQIVNLTENGVLRAIDVHGKESWTQPPRGDIDCATLSKDSTLALTSDETGLSVWRVSRPPEVRELAVGQSFPGVSISSDGWLVLARLALRSMGQSSCLVDAATGKHLTPQTIPMGSITAMSRDGRMIASLEHRQALSVWSLDSPHETRRFVIEHPMSIGQPVIAISSDGGKAAISVGNGSSIICDVQGKSEKPKFLGHLAPITSAMFSLDGRMLLTGSEDRTARVWDANTGATMAVLRGHDASVNAVAMSDDGKLAITASGAQAFQSGNDNSVRLWELPSGKLLTVLQNHSARVNAVAITSDGQLIASGGDDETVTLWDRASGAGVRTIHTPHGPILSLAFDQNGHSLVVGSRDALSLWNLNRPIERRELESAVSAVRAKNDSTPVTPADCLTLGRWYAFQAEPAWAARFFQQGEAGGMAVPVLERWRCDWERGDLAAAERDIKSIPAQDAPASYVKLCADAMRLEKDHR